MEIFWQLKIRGSNRPSILRSLCEISCRNHKKNTHDCDPNAACVNISPGYNCTCSQPTWQGDGKNCYYFDPCFADPCSEHSTCVVDNTADGYYSCPCTFPRVGSGLLKIVFKIFSKIFLKKLKKCFFFNFAFFLGKIGGCSCPTGFWDKYTLNCVDIDECSILANETDKVLLTSRHQPGCQLFNLPARTALQVG